MGRILGEAWGGVEQKHGVWGSRHQMQSIQWESWCCMWYIYRAWASWGVDGEAPGDRGMAWGVGIEPTSWGGMWWGRADFFGDCSAQHHHLLQQA